MPDQTYLSTTHFPAEEKQFLCLQVVEDGSKLYFTMVRTKEGTTYQSCHVPFSVEQFNKFAEFIWEVAAKTREFPESPPLLTAEDLLVRGQNDEEHAIERPAVDRDASAGRTSD